MEDLPLLRRWQAAPHVARWWDDDEPFSAKDLDDPTIARWMVSAEDALFAYMQDYAVHGSGPHHFDALPAGSRGIDQYIGEPSMLGRGHGVGMIGQRIAELFAKGAPAIGVDPHPDNARAIAVYRKLGFVVSGPSRQTPWGLILPMVRRA